METTVLYLRVGIDAGDALRRLSARSGVPLAKLADFILVDTLVSDHDERPQAQYIRESIAAYRAAQEGQMR